MEAPNVDITFVEGLTWDTLPDWMPKIGSWDFLFQDTLHDLGPTVREWKLYSPYARTGSIVIFDDVYPTSGVIEYFKEKEKGWKWIHTDIGHKQLWGEKVGTVEEVIEVKVDGIHGTGRFMCLSCGRFFSMNHSFTSGKTVCPFCKDMYFCDNIIPNTPKYIVGPFTLIFDCGHQIQTDFVGDVKYCPVCGKSIDPIPGIHSKDWQNLIIKEFSL
jgi:hypothetical protein